MKRKQVPVEAVVSLRQRLEIFPHRCAERRRFVEETAHSYGISSSNLYRILRERELRELIKKGKKPVSLFVDEAHGLHGTTLTGLKRLIETVEDAEGFRSFWRDIRN